MAAPTVVYVAGFGRSGTTMLERILGELPGVCALGEVVHLWHRGVELDETCGCGEPFHRCPFWEEVGNRAYGGWDRLPLARVETLRKTIDRTRHVPGIAARGWMPRLAGKVDEYTAHYRRVYDAAAATAGASYVIDSSKHPSLAFGLATRSDLDLRVVHMVRDPRAVAYSWTRTVERPEAGDVEAEMWRYSPARAAMNWFGQNLLLDRLRHTSVPATLLRHEDMLADARAEVGRVAQWLGLDAGSVPVTADGVASLTFAHTVSGNPARFATGKVRITASDRWRRELPSRDRRAVTALALPLLAAYGYSASSS